MRSKADTYSEEAEKAVRDIRRATRLQFAAEEKVRIVRARRASRMSKMALIWHRTRCPKGMVAAK
jgi:hypothetical protein